MTPSYSIHTEQRSAPMGWPKEAVVTLERLVLEAKREGDLLLRKAVFDAQVDTVRAQFALDGGVEWREAPVGPER